MSSNKEEELNEEELKEARKRLSKLKKDIEIAKTDTDRNLAIKKWEVYQDIVNRIYGIKVG